MKARQGNSFIDRLGTALVRLMADTGCRIGEACSLTLADVDLHAGVVTFRRTKNGDVRQVGIGPSLARESAKINAFEAALKAGTIQPWKADPVTLVQPLPA